MNRKIIIIALFLAVIGFSAISLLPKYYFSAKPVCFNVDIYFDTHEWQTPGYQKKVKHVLSRSSPEDFRYFFVTFTGEKERYMVVNMRNNDYCFDAKMLVSQLDKLKGMRSTNGVSYPEEVYDLSWKIEEIEGKSEIVYLDMARIID